MGSRCELAEKLAEVSAYAKLLVEMADWATPEQLQTTCSKLAWANNYLTVAALKFVGEVIRKVEGDT